MCSAKTHRPSSLGLRILLAQVFRVGLGLLLFLLATVAAQLAIRVSQEAPGVAMADRGAPQTCCGRTGTADHGHRDDHHGNYQGGRDQKARPCAF